MSDLDDSDAQARQIQRGIERTREDMDLTLSELERRLAPSEIIQSSAETVRDGLRSRARSTVDSLKRHPVPIGIAAMLIGARLGFRPSAADRDRLRAQQDLQRVFDVFGVAFERAKERSQVEASRRADLGRDAINHPGRYAAPALRAAERLGRMSGERTLRTLQRAAEESRAVSQAMRREAASYPLGALVVFGVAAGVAMLGTRGLRGWREQRSSRQATSGSDWSSSRRRHRATSTAPAPSAL